MARMLRWSVNKGCLKDYAYDKHLHEQEIGWAKSGRTISQLYFFRLAHTEADTSLAVQLKLLVLPG